MSNISFGGDYYSRAVGFVIDGNLFCNRDTAAEYLKDTGMESGEATSYLSRLIKVANMAARKAVQA